MRPITQPLHGGFLSLFATECFDVRIHLRRFRYMNREMNTAVTRSEKRSKWAAAFEPSERKRLSQKARKIIFDEIGNVATEFGYLKRDNHFEKKRFTRRLSLGLQPSQHGFECFINLGVTATLPFKLRGNDVFRIGNFYDRPKTPDGEPGALVYFDVINETDHLAYACLVLRERALPFLEAGKSRHELRDWLAQRPPLPETSHP